MCPRTLWLLDEFRSMLPDFYAQAGIDSLWRRCAASALDHMIQVYHSCP